MRAGETVGDRFVIEQSAGSGGMGEVFRARDRTTGERVALKLLHKARAIEHARFEREAQALAELRHPGVVRYVAHGISPEGEPYLAMEWLEGEDLATRLQRGRLTVEESVALMARVADALSVAHARGIVHRDLKPSNLFLVGGDVAHVKVLDFGIARVGNLPPVTHSGTVLGTPGYMAPEQVRSSQSLDARADIFTLGCVFFECLTGAPAFAGAQVMAVLAKILFEEAPRPAELRPEIPAPLDALVAQMVAKHPSARPRDAAAVAVALAMLGPSGNAQGAPWAGGAAGSPGSSVDDSQPTLAITRSERRVLSVVLVQGTDVLEGPASPSAATKMDSFPVNEALLRAAKAWGERAEMLADGSVVVAIAGAQVATDQAVQAARCALAMRAASQGRPIALATGRGEAAGKLGVGGVIDKAASLLAAFASAPPSMSVSARRPRPGEPRPSSNPPQSRFGPPIAIDEVTAGLLDSRFVVVEGRAGLELREEREIEAEGVRTLLGKLTPCVGRDRELGELEALFVECVGAQTAQAVLVTAPAGVGKSRVAHELIRRLGKAANPPGEGGDEARDAPPESMIPLPAPVEIWFARGDSLAAGSAFGLLGQALRRACGIQGGEPIDVRRQKLLARVSRHVSPADRRWVSEFLGELIGSPLADDGSAPLRAARQDSMLMGDQMRRAWECFLRAEVTAHPVLVVLDDLHWGDLPSVQFIEMALRHHRKKPWMVLALARPEVHELFRKLWSDASLHEIRLGNLPARAGRRLVRQVLGDKAAIETIERIVTQADGNAFYLEELIRAVAEGKEASLPETVLAMVQARLDGLEAEARRILRAASVFGEVFWQGGMVALLGGLLPPAQAADWIESLVEREVLARRLASRFPDEPELGFRHGLLREGAYATLTEDDRELGHRLAGEWLEKHGESDPMVLAEHFERGKDPARAASHYLRASEQAQRGGDSEAAVLRARRGLACGAPDDLSVQLLSVLCEAFLWRGARDVAEASEHAERVLRIATPGSAPWARGGAAKLVGLLHAGDTAGFASALGKLASPRPSPDAVDAYASSLAAVVLVSCMEGRVGLAADAMKQLHAVVDPVAERDARARGFLHVVHGIYEPYASEDLAGGLRHADTAAASFLEAEHAHGALLSRLLRGMNLWFLGASAQAARELGALADRDDEAGRFAALRPICYVGALAATGDLGRALAEAQRVIEAGRARGLPRYEGYGRWALAGVLLRQNELDAAEREAVLAAELLAPFPTDRIGAQATLASVWLAKGRATEALASAEDALRKVTLQGVCSFFRGGHVRLVYAEALHAAGGRERARAAITMAKRRVLAAASAIGDSGMRRSFLQDVPENARTLELAQQWLGATTLLPR